jgi:hypothetical protein
MIRVQKTLVWTKQHFQALKGQFHLESHVHADMILVMNAVGLLLPQLLPLPLLLLLLLLLPIHLLIHSILLRHSNNSGHN